MTRGPLTLLLLAVVIGGWLRWEHVWEAGESGARGINTTWYAMQSVRHFEEHGFVATRGVPVLQSWPGTLDECVRYVSHPAPMTWLWWLGTQLCAGDAEAGVKLFPLLANLLSIWLCWLVLRDLAAPLAAAAGTLIFATLPMCTYYGSMPSGEALLLPLLWLCWRAWRRWSTGASGAWPLVLLFFGACCWDWACYWIAPALAAVAVIQGAWQRSWRVLLMLVLAGCCAFALFVLHMSWAVGGLDAFLAQLRAASGLVQEHAGPAALSAQSEFALQLYGWPALLLLGAGLLAVRRGSALLPLLVFAGGVATLHTLVFLRHASDHDFWTLALSPAFAVAAAALVERCASRFALPLLLLSISMAGALRAHQLSTERRAPHFAAEVAQITQLSEPDTVALVSPFWIQQIAFARAHVFPTVDSVGKAQAFAAMYARLYSQSPRRPALMAILPSGLLRGELLRLREWYQSLGITPQQRGRHELWFLPGA